MEWPSCFLVSLVIIILSSTRLLLLLLLRHRRISGGQSCCVVPPGPPGWPIIGNMFDLGTMPHRTLTDLRQKYGPVIWLRIGAINTMAILSTKAATEFFKNHDLCFTDRFITETMRARNFNKSALSLAPYGSHWRELRRLVTVDMLVNKRINETASIRRKCVDDLLPWIEEEGNKLRGRGIQVARFVFLATFNLLGNLMLSRDLLDPNSKDGADFFAAMMGLTHWTGCKNVADYFPWLSRIDPQGLRRKMERDLGKALEIASKFVKERVKENNIGKEKKKKKDFLDVLLEFEDNGKDEMDKITERDINILILVRPSL